MPRGHGSGSRNQRLPQTCVTIASPRHPDLDTSGRHWTDLDPMRGTCGGDAGTRTRTGVSPSDFKSRAVLALRAREGRFYPQLQSSCVTIARGWHPHSDGCNTRPLSAPHPCSGSSRGGGQGGPAGATCRAVLSGEVPGKAQHPRRRARGRSLNGSIVGEQKVAQHWHTTTAHQIRHPRPTS